MQKMIIMLVLMLTQLGCFWGEESDPAEHVYGNYYLVFTADSTNLLLKDESNSASGNIVFDRNIDSLAIIRDTIYLLTTNKELYVVTSKSAPKGDSVTDKSKLPFERAFNPYR